MYEQYIWKRVRLISLENPRIYGFQGHNIGFNDDMIKTIKNNPYVEVIWETSLFDGVVLMRAEFSDWREWYIIPDWIEDKDGGVARQELCRCKRP